MHLRRFVLEPINEIAPDFIHPIFNMSIEDLLKKCPDESQVLFFDKLNFDN
jgi:2-amino-4-hydroxy-6-hydroxymethyldihydropteridine diphosphokinase